MTFIELLHRLRASAAARYDFTIEAYYYCRHSKQSARLKRKLAGQYKLIAFYDEAIAKREREGGRINAKRH